MNGNPPGQPADATRPTVPVLPPPGTILGGKYRIERILGEGATAVVFEATHLRLEDRVAIKVLLPQCAEEPDVVERFMREGRAAKKIRSEHVVRVFDVGLIDRHPYLVMEFLDGSDLDQLLAQDGPLPVGVAVEYVLQACEAIVEAHVLGIVHRDLKPANLFLTRRADGSACVKVLDFGISKALLGSPVSGSDLHGTLPTAILGSPHYMSPEQVQSSRDVDIRSDVWALGAILHELIAGAPPFEGENVATLSVAILRDPAPRLGSRNAAVPPHVEAVALRCLEKDPSRRFANVAELAAALAEGGGAAARASAERIARVIELGTGRLGLPFTPPLEWKAMGSLRGARGAPRPGVRLLRRVAGAVAVLGAVIGIGVMVMRDRAKREAKAQPSTFAQSVALPTPAASSTPAPPAGHAGVGAVPPAEPSASAQPKAPSAPTGPVTPRRSKWRAPRAQPRMAPLPDFPVPSVDPNEGLPPAVQGKSAPPQSGPGPAPSGSP